MAIEGIREIDDFVGTNAERPQSWMKGIQSLFPNGAGMKAAGLQVLKRQLGGGDRGETDVVYHWFEKSQRSYNFTLASSATALAAISGSATPTANLTIVTERSAAQNVAAGEAPDQQECTSLWLKRGDLLYVEATGEVMRVHTDPSAAATIPVQRNINGATSFDAVDTTAATTNPHVSLIGSAYGEASKAPTSQVFAPEQKTNLIQVFRDSVSVTRQAQATEVRTEDPRTQEMNEAMARMLIGAERAFWYGVYNTGITTTTAENEGTVRTMGGILSQIPSTNTVSPPPGDNNKPDLGWIEDTLQRIFSGYGSGERVCFCGSKFLLAINQAVRLGGEGQYEFKQNEVEYGFRVKRLYTTMGTLVLMHHPLFDRSPSSITSAGAVNYLGMDSAGVILDMAKVRHHYLKNGRTGGGLKTWKMQDPLYNINGEDVEKWGLMMESSISLMNPSAHWRINGLIGGKA